MSPLVSFDLVSEELRQQHSLQFFEPGRIQHACDLVSRCRGLRHGQLSSAKKTRNFIYVVPDGFGPASQTLTRDYLTMGKGAEGTGKPNSTRIGVDNMRYSSSAKMIGSVRTRSFDNLITDSAAAATAFSSGHKTYNRAIGVDPYVRPVASVLEAAHLNGFKTGLVATARVTDATPASYCAHVPDRKLEDEIASQQIGYSHPLGPVVDVIMGGGRRHYLPRRLGGKRTGYDLITWAKALGYSYAANRHELAEYTNDLGKGIFPVPFLGLFAESHMAYDIDRDPDKEPSLLEMTEAAVRSLAAATAKTEKGYFIMIEASQIDDAAHANDIAAHVNDAVMYNRVMDFLRKYVAKHPNTQLLSAADHECGGLTLTSGYDPSALAGAKRSTAFLQRAFHNSTEPDRATYLRKSILPQYGLRNTSDAAVDKYMDVYRREGESGLGRAMARDLAAQVGVKWSTTGHSAVDVNLYGLAVGKAYARMKTQVGGHVDNTELPRYIAKTLGLDLDNATGVLRDSWVRYEGGPNCLGEGDAAACKRPL
ncbi:Alkaline phosphatase-like, alpha/beta/alpha [Metarhizium album ARSEF 1941]|uniref:Alkaline phosphatase n=1 Tax=Metarhizium album (strain ARSEF 1941) TaxID=1081103 RepID=A0A0B2WV05_METAS|nr:Alkaline phosphatase-like, alpha/beta/alpha [Metarhizium album ARSEF 1941]KHN97262.1 Alkaline phosphatase-like, alpha/beta/alpha [Metarhizium album ARSEF 1941]